MEHESRLRAIDISGHRFDLHHSLSNLGVEARESAAQEGLRLLQAFQPSLRNPPDNVDVSSWIEQSKRAVDQVLQKKSTIGIVGGTGAGKTSFINAIVDEESLLPTNCMRACTATITEISYSNGPMKYRAQIEFLGREDWREELTQGFQVLFDKSHKIVRDATNEDSEAGIFYSKIRAVYASATREDIEAATIDNLLYHPDVDVLGHSEAFEDNEAASFSRRLQTIIDSRDRVSRSAQRVPAYWPIIRRVRLYVKAPALANGVTLVDLPGIQDSTAARAAVAESYMKSCSGLMIAAPIHRAADDRIARNLMGPKFRRQVMMDGGYTTMTFVCTKIDDINIREAATSPELTDRLQKLASEIERLRFKREHLMTAIEAAMPQLSEAERSYMKARANLDVCEDIVRAAHGLLSEARQIVASQIAGVVEQTEDLDKDNTARRTVEVAQQELERALQQSLEKKQQSDEAQAVKETAADEAQKLRSALQETDDSIFKLEGEKRSICVRFRSRYVSDAIKQDFVSGVKEFDQDRMAHDDLANWDPDSAIRDYDKLAAELPVFPVSALAYQQKMGRLRDEPATPGFASLEDTGIPAARRHCEKLTQVGRMKNANFFLAMLSKLLNNMNLWLSNELSGSNTSDAQREQVKLGLQEKLTALKHSFSKLIRDTVLEMGRRMKKLIYNHLDAARINASNASIPTAQAWCGSTHSTWKAICRRRGAFSNENGSYDWNEDLAGPLIDHLAPQWEQAFSTALDQVFNDFAAKARKKIKIFHTSVPEVLTPLGIRNTRREMRMLEVQGAGYKASLLQIAEMAQQYIHSSQREINREFKPLVTQQMLSAYVHCTEECGPGSFKRMQDHMKNHLATNGAELFREATRGIQSQLDTLLKSVKEMLTDDIMTLQAEIESDYIGTFCGRNDDGEQVKTDAADLFTADVAHFLQRSKRCFDNLAFIHSSRIAVKRERDEEEADAVHGYRDGRFELGASATKFSRSEDWGREKTEQPATKPAEKQETADDGSDEVEFLGKSQTGVEEKWQTAPDLKWPPETIVVEDD